MADKQQSIKHTEGEVAPQLRKLARALIALARWQLAAEAKSTGQNKESGR